MAENSGYGKRPLWQWILIYIVIGAIVYYLIYHFAYANKGGYGSSSYSAPAASQGSSTGY